LAFFSRPKEDALLYALTDESPMIAEAVAQCANPDKFNTGQTAGAWFARRIKNERIANRKVWPTLFYFSQVGVRWLIPAS
jgi:hypothetical protein